MYGEWQWDKKITQSKKKANVYFIWATYFPEAAGKFCGHFLMGSCRFPPFAWVALMAIFQLQPQHSLKKWCWFKFQSRLVRSYWSDNLWGNKTLSEIRHRIVVDVYRVFQFKFLVLPSWCVWGFRECSWMSQNSVREGSFIREATTMEFW